MSENLISPERPITLDGKEYTLSGTFKALKAIQQSFDCEILRFLGQQVGTLPFDDAAKVIQLAIEAGGQVPPSLDIIEREIVEEIGIVEVRQIIGQWLLLAVTPKKEREKKAQELAEALRPKASRGKSTSNTD